MRPSAVWPSFLVLPSSDGSADHLLLDVGPTGEGLREGEGISARLEFTLAWAHGVGR